MRFAAVGFGGLAPFGFGGFGCRLVLGGFGCRCFVDAIGRFGLARVPLCCRRHWAFSGLITHSCGCCCWCIRVRGFVVGAFVCGVLLLAHSCAGFCG